MDLNEIIGQNWPTIVLTITTVWGFWKADLFPWLKTRADKAAAAQGTMFDRLLESFNRHTEALERNVTAMTQAVERQTLVMSKVDTSVLALGPTIIKAVEDSKQSTHEILRTILAEVSDIRDTVSDLCVSLDYKPATRNQRSRNHSAAKTVPLIPPPPPLTEAGQ